MKHIELFEGHVDGGKGYSIIINDDASLLARYFLKNNVCPATGKKFGETITMDDGALSLYTKDDKCAKEFSKLLKDNGASNTIKRFNK